MIKRTLAIAISGCVLCFYQILGFNVLASIPVAFAETNENTNPATLPQDPDTLLEPSGDDTGESDEMGQANSEDEDVETTDESDEEYEEEYDDEDENN
jgi:hypothetical protein